MTQVEVYKDHALAFSTPFSADTFTIGRSSHCDICLPDANISRTHLLIQKKDKRFTVIDKSTNGTHLNGNELSKSEIEFGDEISIAGWKVKIRPIKHADEVTEVILNRDPTCILSQLEDQHELAQVKPVLAQTSPIKRNFPMKNNILSIGKNNSNDVILQDEYVSNFHFKIEFRDGGFFIKDLKSTNGTFVNGMKIMEAYVIDKSVIEIGKIQFQFQISHEKKKLVIPDQNHFHGMISKDERMIKLFELISSLEKISSPVLIQGETGTGKELVARAIHDNSSRKSKRFVAVNCGAIPKELIESEIFGHEKGAFTGAASQREGLFEQAHEGTLFLDEIGELPLELQPKLLRVLETGEIRRVGSSKNIHVNVRLVTATHRNLHQEVQNGLFREDLFYRIYVLPIILPALRERKKDIPYLIEHFLTKEKKRIHPLALQKLEVHPWPGNIRELKNVVDRALTFGLHTSDILPEHVRFAGEPPEPSPDSMQKPDMTLEEMEKNAISKVLYETQWNKKQTAEKLGIAKSTLHDKIRKYEIVETIGDS